MLCCAAFLYGSRDLYLAYIIPYYDVGIANELGIIFNEHGDSFDAWHT